MDKALEYENLDYTIWAFQYAGLKGVKSILCLLNGIYLKCEFIIFLKLYDENAFVAIMQRIIRPNLNSKGNFFFRLDFKLKN